MVNRRRTAAALLPTLLLAGCATTGLLESELKTAIRGSAGGSFALSEVEGVDGSSFLVICPYESTELIESRLNFAWSDAPDYSKADDRQTIAVISDGEVASATEISRDTIDFCSAGPWEVLFVETELAVSGSTDTAQVTVASR
ncbi:hypothetical protein ACNI3K_02725 [Demequina sp. SO4-13]|uniref:hypothetical protein n=1 Tax=Demequina sp. SO4-13 TaxID=3401027 RepID=UPI003AF5FF27